MKEFIYNVIVAYLCLLLWGGDNPVEGVVIAVTSILIFRVLVDLERG